MKTARKWLSLILMLALMLSLVHSRARPQTPPRW